MRVGPLGMHLLEVTPLSRSSVLSAQLYLGLQRNRHVLHAIGMSDIVGLDLGMPRDDDLNPVPRNPDAVIQDALVAAGRLGQKSGGGFFDYDESRKAAPSAEVAEIIAKVAAHNGIAQQEIPVCLTPNS